MSPGYAEAVMLDHAIDLLALCEEMGWDYCTVYATRVDGQWMVMGHSDGESFHRFLEDDE